MGKAPGIPAPMDHVGAAALAREVGAAATVTSETLSFSSITLREPRAIEVFPDIGDDVDARLIEPLANDGQADICLVLVIRYEDLDLDVRVGAGEFLHGCRVQATDVGPDRSL